MSGIEDLKKDVKLITERVKGRFKIEETQEDFFRAIEPLLKDSAMRSKIVNELKKSSDIKKEEMVKILAEVLKKALFDIKFEPHIEIPEIKSPKIPPIQVKIPPFPKQEVIIKEVQGKESKIVFPETTEVKGFSEFTKAVFKFLESKSENQSSSDKPTPVFLTFKGKEYIAMGGGGGPDNVSIKNPEVSTTPYIYNVAISAVNTEYSQALPEGTRKIRIKLRQLNATLRFSFNVGESGTTYITIPYGAAYPIEGLKLSGKTIYFQTPQYNTATPYNCEIEAWV